MMRLLIILNLFFMSFTSYGRWASLDEASFQVYSKVHVKINKDGSSEEEIELTYFLKKVAAKDGLGTYPIVYSPSYEKLELLEAYSVTAGKKYKPQRVEDKAIASTVLEGFDANNRMTLNFAQVQVGSQLFLKYKIFKKPLIKDFASVSLSSWNYYPVLKGSSLTLESEVPLYSKLKGFQTDLKKNLLIKKSFDKKKKLYRYSVEAKKDLYYQITDEKYAYTKESLPYLSFATNKSYEGMVKSLVGKFQEKIDQAQPKELKEFSKLAQGKGLVDRAEAVMAKLMEKFRYSGDWRTVEGSYVPRSKADIITTGYGDCKDFSLLMASILREMGYDAYQALVKRSQSHQVDLLLNLPSYQSFNHAIVYVKHKGKSYWFDPTNPLSFGKRALRDISGRRGLVLAKKPFLKEIPKVKPKDSLVKIDQETSLLDKNLRKVKTVYNYHGLVAFDVHNRYYDISYKEGYDFLLNSTVGSHELIKVHTLKFPQNLKRIVNSDIRTEAEVVYYSPIVKTTAGEGLAAIEESIISFFQKFDPKKYVCAGISLDGTFKRKIYSVIKNKKLRSEKQKIETKVSSPWVDYKRVIQQKGNDIIVTSDLQIKKSIVKNKELHSKAFSKFQKKLREEADELILIFTEV